MSLSCMRIEESTQECKGPHLMLLGNGIMPPKSCHSSMINLTLAFRKAKPKQMAGENGQHLG